MPSLPMLHPTYLSNQSEWQKWRLTYTGGEAFINRYLYQYSTREDSADYASRKVLTYNPADAKAAVEEVRNLICQHLPFVRRMGGPHNYQEACEGYGGGVDRSGKGMTTFIATDILPELLVMQKVGVFVDMDANIGPTAAHVNGKRPYIYAYPRERISNWAVDQQNPRIFTEVLLADQVVVPVTDSDLPSSDFQKIFRRFKKIPGKGVLYEIYDDDKLESPKESRMLDLPNIPFYVFELSTSLMVDICQHQIALLNLESSDVNYCWKANFPLFVQPYDPRRGSPYVKTGDNQDDTGDEVETGPTKGLYYPNGQDAPSFISPPSGPLEASIEKQNQIKQGIRQALNLAVGKLNPMGDGSINAGLAYIGMVLQAGEEMIANFWCMYLKEKDIPTIFYPESYECTTEKDRLEAAKSRKELLGLVSSPTYRREMQKIIACGLLGGKTTPDVLAKIYGEVERAKILDLDPVSIEMYADKGLAGKKCLAGALGIPESEVDVAKEEHLAEVIAVAAAQTPDIGPHTEAAGGGGKLKNPQSRGVPQLAPGQTQQSSQEKKQSQQNTPDKRRQDNTRGDGK